MKITYPELTLWNTQAPLISWINPEGFDLDHHLDVRGLKGHTLSFSFGTSDRDEALRRQRLMRFVIENQDIRDFAITWPFGEESHGISNFPKDGQRFVDYFNPHKRNAFWEKAERFLSLVDKASNVPSEISRLAAFIRQSMNATETEERAMGSFVVEELLKATDISGTVVLRLARGDRYNGGSYEFSSIEAKAIGHRLYTLEPPPADLEIPDFLENDIFRKIKVTDLVLWLAKSRRNKKLKRWATPLLIDEAPKDVTNTIVEFFNKFLQGGQPMPMLRLMGSVDFMVRFSYQGHGLRLRLVGLSQETLESPAGFKAGWSAKVATSDFAWLSDEQRQFVRGMSSDMNRRAYASYLMSGFYPEFEGWLKDHWPKLLSDEGLNVDSPRIDHKYGWSQAEALCLLPDWRDVHDNAEGIRAFVREHMSILGLIASLAQKMLDRAEAWGKPLEFPEIVNSGEGIFSFHELWPVDLIGQKTSASHDKAITPSELEPITALGELGGSVTLLTGDNVAGKTTTNAAIAGAFFDAASGLPIFGKGVKLNLRTVIGMVFLDRGAGSTMQRSMRKLAGVIEEVAKHPQNGNVVLWDEIGTGTEAMQGLQLGLAGLKRLGSIGCMTVGNTQIPALAERARSELGARCFKIDGDHRITEGVGVPDIRDLAKREGVAETLGL